MNEADAAAAPERAAHVLDKLYGMAEGELCWPDLVETLLGLLDEAEQAQGLDPRRLAWLAPHLARVLRQQAERVEQAEPLAFQQRMLDEHPLAMGLYRRDGQQLWANAQMRELLDHLDGEPLGALLAAEELPRKLLFKPATGPFELLALHVPELGPDRVALLGRATGSRSVDAGLLRLQFGLTETEAAVAQQIAAGLGPEAIAAEHGTSLNTVRSQLKAVMSKTGTQRQNELAARLLAAPAAFQRSSAGQAPVASKGMAERVRVRGRELAYASYGAADGPTLFFMHSWAGGRLQLPPAAMLGPQSAARHGLRVIAVDRPGCGLSGPADDCDPREWALCLAELADRLGVARFSVLGYSLGAIYAIHCAHFLPQRVERAFLVSPVAPLRKLADLGGTLPSGRLLLALAMYMPALAGPFVRLWMARMRRQPELYLESVMPYLAPRDLAVMRDPQTREHYLRSFVDAIQQGDEALLRELQLLVSPWDRGLLPLQQACMVWHGAQDSHIDPEHGRRVAESLGNARFQLVPESGHYLLYHQWPQIAAAMAAELKDAVAA